MEENPGHKHSLLASNDEWIKSLQVYEVEVLSNKLRVLVTCASTLDLPKF